MQRDTGDQNILSFETYITGSIPVLPLHQVIKSSMVLCSKNGHGKQTPVYLGSYVPVFHLRENKPCSLRYLVEKEE